MNGKIQLSAPMPNGATVSDWLGTANSAVALAHTTIAAVRANEMGNDIAQLQMAQRWLNQAAEEVAAVLNRVGV